MTYLGFQCLPTAPADDATMVSGLLHKGLYYGYRLTSWLVVAWHC
jgi:hypothetical protein